MKKNKKVVKPRAIVAKILKLTAKGFSQREVGRKLGISRSMVYYWIHK